MNKSDRDNTPQETLTKWTTITLSPTLSNPKELTLSISLPKLTNKLSANFMFIGKRPTSLSALNTEKVKKLESLFIKMNKESLLTDLFTWLTVSHLMSKKAAVIKSDFYLQVESKNLSHWPSVKCSIHPKDFSTPMMSLPNNKKSHQLLTKFKYFFIKMKAFFSIS